MKSPNRPMLAFAVLLCWILVGLSEGSAASQIDPEVPPSNLITKTVSAIGFQVGGGRTNVDLKSTELMPQARGIAKVEAKTTAGRTKVEVELKYMTPP